MATAEFEQANLLLDGAIDLLVSSGFDRKRVKIPKPLASNIESDRIYFTVCLDGRWEARTAFLHLDASQNQIELTILAGWPIEEPAEGPALVLT